MIKMRKHWLIMTAVFALLLALITVPVRANATNGLTFTATNGGIESDNTDSARLKVSATGYIWGTSTKNSVITVKNDTGSKVTISFDFTIAYEGGSAEIKGVEISGNSAKVTLDKGGTFTIDMKCTSPRAGTSYAEVTITNIKITKILESAQVQVLYDNAMGTVKNGSTVVNNGATITTTLDAPVTLTASPATGCTFVAWADADNKFLSTNTSYTVQPTTENMTAKAIFSDGTPWFYVENGTRLVEGWDAAMAVGGTVTLANNAILTARETAYNVPSNVNLLIPFGATDTGCFGAIPESNLQHSTANPTTYRTLTVADGAKITVNGKMNVNGQRNTATQGKTGTGVAKGGHGLVILESANGSNQITVNNGGTMTCYGFIKGTGRVVLENGGTLHELMQVYDWAGGSNLSDWYMKMGGKEERTMFFLAHYYVQNVEAPLTVRYGGVMYVEGVMAVSNIPIVSSAKIVSKDSGEGLFLLQSGNHLERTYSPATDRVEYHLRGKGNVNFGSIKVKVKVLFEVELDSATYTLPLNHAMTIRIGDEVTMNMGNRVAMMPDSQVIVEKDAKLNLSNHLYIFDKEDKVADLFFDDDKLAPDYTASRGTSAKITAHTNSARVEINGTLNLTGNGSLYTTNGHSNVDKVIYGTGTINHTGTTGKGTLRGGFNSTFPSVSVTDCLAYLAGKHMDAEGNMKMAAMGTGTYIGLGEDHNNIWYETKTEVPATCSSDAYTMYNTTGGSAEGYRVYEEGTQNPEAHVVVVDSAVAATCTATGLTEGSHCSACGEVLVAQETVAALGHTEVVDAAKAPSCTETGLTEGSHCSVCNEVFVAQTVVEALGHDEVIDEAVEPTCTETGLTEGKHCSVCNETLVAQVTVDALGHNEEIDAAVEATCTNDGLTEGKHCTVCNEVIVAQEVVKAQGHNYNAVVTEPDCVNGGYTTNTCTVCGDSYVNDETAALGHKMSEATCTAPKTCSVCGNTEGEALGHTEETVAGKAATCTETGLTEGKKCTVCGTFTDAQEVIPALGHTEVTDAAVDPTCTATGLTEGKHCSVCNAVLVAQETVPVAAHSYKADVTAPTCTEDGYTTYTCACGDSYVDSYVTATGHTWKDATCTASKTCSVCDFTEGEALGHNYGSVTTAPTCTEKGYTTYTCACGDTYVADEVAALGHDYTSVTKDPTCTAEGSTTYTCTVCGDSYNEPIEALGHDYEADVTDPTCTEGGYTTYTCACGDSYTGDETEATGHTEGTAIREHEVTTNGSSYDLVVYCQKCSEELSRTTVTTEVKTEDFEDHAIPDTIKESFATADALTGYMEASVSYEYAGKIGEREVESELYDVALGSYKDNVWVPATKENFPANGKLTIIMPVPKGTNIKQYTYFVGHMFTVDAFDKQPGEMEYPEVTAYEDAGIEYIRFEVTGLSPIMVSYAMTNPCGLGHTEEILSNEAPTCLDDGLTEGKKCSVCDTVLVPQQKIDALGHDYNAVVTAPGCTTAGYTTYTCFACGDTYTADEVAAVGHNYEAVVSAPTCEAAGYTTYTCACGDSYVTDKVAALGHSYNAVVTAPDCVAEGYTTYTCGTCGHSYNGDTVAALGHTDGEPVVVNEISATCTTQGSYENVTSCTVCGAETKRETVTVPMAEHSYGETGEVTAAPTCTEVGVMTYTCQNAGCDHKTTEEISATGHSYDNGVVTTPATCEVAGVKTFTCAACGGTRTEGVAAIGHAYNEGVQTTDPTCTEAGVKTFTCQNDASHTYTAEITALGHSEVTDEAVAPNCTNTGLTEGKHCDVCGEVITAQETVDALGHEWTEGVCGTCDAVCEHNFVDGVCDTCGFVKPALTGGIRLASASLNLLDEICIIYKCDNDGIPTNEADVLERKVLLFATAEDAATGDPAKAKEVVTLSWNEKDQKFTGQTKGIAANAMDKSMYAVAYLKLADDTEIYGTKNGVTQAPIKYSPQIYCQNMVEKNKPEAELCRVLMQYGAAAQETQLTPVPSVLMNAGFAPVAYNANVLGEENFSVDITTVNGFTVKSASLDLKGAISYIIKFTADTDVTGSQLYAEYTLGTSAPKSVALVWNASESRYRATITGVAAKDMDETLRIRPYYLDANGEKQYGTELVYSGYEYCRRTIDANKSTKEVNLAQALAMYIYYADLNSKGLLK